MFPENDSRTWRGYADKAEGEGQFPERAQVMKTNRRGFWCAGLVLGLASGCQTWVPEIGMTLPSPNYLLHQPQYIPPSPPYPLSRELASLEQAAAAQQNVPPSFGGP